MIKEGFMPFLEYQTYYRVTGNLQGEKAPLLLLHGGPGSTHNYFEVLDALAEDRALVMYDQLGCGLSSMPHNPDLWTAKTWLSELTALREWLHLDELHLLGQSWGGMLAIQYLIDHRPAGIKSVILSSTLPSASLWAKEQHRLIEGLPEKHREAIHKAEASGNYKDPAYREANTYFMNVHCEYTPRPDLPECVTRPKNIGKEAYLCGWGPNEYTPTGHLKTHEYTERLSEITVPTLIISGARDMCTPLIARTMQEGIPDARHVSFPKSAHMPYIDETEDYIHLVGEWLLSKDS